MIPGRESDAGPDDWRGVGEDELAWRAEEMRGLHDEETDSGEEGGGARRRPPGRDTDRGIPGGASVADERAG